MSGPSAYVRRMHARIVVPLFASLVAATFGCGESTSGGKLKEPAQQHANDMPPQPSPKTSDSGGTPACMPNELCTDKTSCSTDADCSPPPCGPCTSGTVITSQMMAAECVVNPCKNSSAACNAQHLCVVR